MKKNKVVINTKFGGFSLSHEASMVFNNLKKLSEGDVEWIDPNFGFLTDSTPRHDETLIKVVEELGEEANGTSASLSIVELIDNRYLIDSYNGFESVNQPSDIIDWIVIPE